jgi:hypothetical protein
MNIKSRLNKLEQNNPNKPPCFCNKTLLNLWHGKPGADALAYCPDCKDTYDYWMNLAHDAVTSPNLTDLTDEMTEKYNDN